MEITITEKTITTFTDTMTEEEKSDATIEKYTAALRNLMLWLDGACATRQRLADYRDHLLQSHCAATVNGALSAINTWLKYNGMEECRVKLLKVQRRAFYSEKKNSARKNTADCYRRQKEPARNGCT